MHSWPHCCKVHPALSILAERVTMNDPEFKAHNAIPAIDQLPALRFKKFG